MKNLILGTILLISTSAFANNIELSNDSGCLVKQEQRRNAVVLYITKGDQTEVVGFANDYSFGDFTYCADSNTDINFYEGSQGTGIMISCSGHTNGHKETRGRVDLSLKNGILTEIKIDGQVKSFFGWKQDTKIECKNLVQE